MLGGVGLGLNFSFPGFYNSAFECFIRSVIRHKVLCSDFLRHSSALFRQFIEFTSASAQLPLSDFEIKKNCFLFIVSVSLTETSRASMTVSMLSLTGSGFFFRLKVYPDVKII